MGVEDLEQLDVGGGQRDEISLVLAFQLGGRELAQHGEHLVAHEREDAKRQVMVAQLLAVTQRSRARSRRWRRGCRSRSA